MDRYIKLKEHILGYLKARLPDNLYYHSYNHVIDVLGAAEFLAEKEGLSPITKELVKVAALFHDSGFTIEAREHEKLSCDIARELLPEFGYTLAEIELIAAMIMATKYPQSPTNLMEEIICDADLDYLGREDFFEIGGLLLTELNESGRFKTEKDWNHFQEKFISSHKYFTKTAQELREPKKLEHLKMIRESLKD
ncbi:MAG TPA: HD domain-containing protein [Bacteroidia bacterium]|nr:HD domain-containing protein [Bacteroidia bacterium]